MNDERPRSLTIAVLTFRRPRDLDEVLPLLVEEAASIETLGVPARVLVVDNDPEASARELASGRDGVDYVHEPTPGIAAARNRALRESAGSDLLAFIDDDERPSRDWLASLVGLLLARSAAAVVGPVVSRYDVEPDAWITAGRFFQRRRLETGTVLDVAATNNLLLDLRVVRRLGLEFDLSLGISGGEDTLFTRQLVGHGGLMLWCAEATVTDVVPAARVTRQWVLQRAFSSGNGWSVTSVMLADRPRRLSTRLRMTATGAVRVAGGAGRLAVGAVTRSTEQNARGSRTLARGAGMVSGAWGHRFNEYRR
ncbi:glycosyl transferase family 2 [Frondihabitans sp. PAMC 28766]|uniref:glycosyltransferase family 2 protein n=1 Tax=Frondihabitans sp. PAMC 28766 TaxID=1795630 RepID=UPI00078E22BA|nr:glycosyltransferase [Frondihabitans sp. PAMC 28766]AMM21988.1 glycosyl transferase family 2 [Frondihabitans sp. PAMC 28766]